jgi:hypothetical protein
MENDIITFCRALNECFKNIGWRLKKTEKFSNYIKYYFYAKDYDSDNEHFQELFTDMGCLSYFSVKGRDRYMTVVIEDDKFNAVVGCLLLNKNKY